MIFEIEHVSADDAGGTDAKSIRAVKRADVHFKTGVFITGENWIGERHRDGGAGLDASDFLVESAVVRRQIAGIIGRDDAKRP